MLLAGSVLEIYGDPVLTVNACLEQHGSGG